MTDLNLWKGKTALVTGASAGIGQAVASNLAQAGLNVVVCARRREKLDLIENVTPITVDLRREDQILSMFQRIRSDFGGVQVIVNNAGLGHKSALMDGDSEKWREMLEVNVLALCICTREAVKDMRRLGDRGHVVHISSMAGHRVPNCAGVYSATKFAVNGLTEGLRQELREAKSNIRVSAISPGLVDTEFLGKYVGDPKLADEKYKQFKLLSAQDVAEAVHYVLSCPEHVQIHDVLLRPTQQTS